jgi:hypothetical protein
LDDSPAQYPVTGIEHGHLPRGDIPQRLFEYHTRAAVCLRKNARFGGHSPGADHHLNLKVSGWGTAGNPVHLCGAQFALA